MIKVLNDFPDEVAGFSGEGKVTGKDYENVLIPAIEEKLKTHKKIRLFYQLGEDFDRFDLAAMVDDAKVGMKHLSAWEKIAFVSDHHLINGFVKFFGYILPYKMKVFKNSELEEAKNWIVQN